MNKQPLKPLPNGNELKELVPSYLKRWYALKDYPEQEKVLKKLFCDYAKNTDFHTVMIKVATLDSFYSTQLRSVPEMVNRILAIPNLDMKMEEGCPWLVDEMCEIEGYKPFSFASKYCSHHNNVAYPIYDSFVATVLTAYREKSAFTKIKTNISSYNRKKSYEKDFLPIIEDFREYYGLNKYSFKELDRFLWQLGKEYFKEEKDKPVQYFTAKIGDYSVYIKDDGSVKVLYQECLSEHSVKEDLREVSKLLDGFDFDNGWTTRQAGAKIVKYANEHPECLPKNETNYDNEQTRIHQYETD